MFTGGFYTHFSYNTCLSSQHFLPIKFHSDIHIPLTPSCLIDIISCIVPFKSVT